MAKYTGYIVVAAVLLSILVGSFWDQILQMDAIVDSLVIIFGVILLSLSVWGLRYKPIDWNWPHVWVRPFLPPMGSEKPHDYIDRNILKLAERHQIEG
jgi:hypothetical protein